ncbi:CD80-like C2-set immunoglobulin domain [Popillia japonica]|uniref:CD80-like C2-set immunoglobulin domain n=1 Tax=Popillia japonica TaxID=7064 RepID=A0AAW1JYI0_POPJA
MILFLFPFQSIKVEDDAKLHALRKIRPYSLKIVPSKEDWDFGHMILLPVGTRKGHHHQEPVTNYGITQTAVPPDKPVIYDGKRRDRTILSEPYNEGSDVNLICEVSGGRPKPRVIWFLENRVIDDSYETRSDGTVVNRVTFPNVGRQHLNERLICQASNTNLIQPASKLVILNINLKPQTVNILTKERHVSADKRYEVECRTSGSRPEAVITWWKGSRPVKKLAKNFSEQNNQSLSILTFDPVVEDDGKYLTCRAENPSIPDSALEDKFRLNVHYVPIVTLKMGSSLNPEDIKEGDDVYFECNIRANPKAYKLSWFHNGIEIHHNVSAGVILSDQSLVLQSVTRSTAGEFTCVATNVEGKGTSNPVTLTVRYAPVCVQDKDELYGALKQETVTLRCQVDANPAIVSFHWTFNNSGDLTEVPVSRFTNERYASRLNYTPVSDMDYGTLSCWGRNEVGQQRTLNYTPVSDMDYGTLSCWGRNEVGQQRTPCVFQVVAAGRPFALLNCTMMNQTSDSLQVECTENFDGGLPQTFLMEILEMPTLRSKLNVTSDRTPPHFYAEGLEPGASYRIMLYSVNAKGRSDPTVIDARGRSDPTVIDAVTFKGVAKYTGSSTSMAVSPLILGLMGTAGILTITVCLVLGALCRRHYSRPCHRPDNGSKHVPLEVIPADDLMLDGSITGVRSPTRIDPTLTEPLRNGSSQEGADPDIIRNQYERRTVQGFMKVYEPARIRSDDDNEEEGEEYDFRHIAKETHIPNQTVYRSLQRTGRPQVATIPGSHTLTHKYRGPEVVTTSNRIQESCI